MRIGRAYQQGSEPETWKGATTGPNMGSPLTVRFAKTAALILFMAVTLTATSPAAISPGPVKGKGSGPCRNAKLRVKLLCPDLRVARPSEMYLDRGTIEGKALLRSTNDIRSRGRGPMELRGHRSRPRSMSVMQAIRRKRGGHRFVPSQARLRFFNVGYQWGGSFWKVRDPLRFELWRIGSRGRKTKLVRHGPKQFYCFRDLERTRPGRHSPESPVYPACDQNPQADKVTLGTSVGWSDIYPSDYDHQWINVTGLRGCFAYLLRVDPKGLLVEMNERNNTSQRIVRLPYRRGQKQHCPKPR